MIHNILSLIAVITLLYHQLSYSADFALFMEQFASGATNGEITYQGNIDDATTSATVSQNSVILDTSQSSQLESSVTMQNSANVRARIAQSQPRGLKSLESNTAGNLVIYAKDAGLEGITAETRALADLMPKWLRDQTVARRHNVAGNVLIYDPIDTPRRFFWSGIGPVYRHGDCLAGANCQNAAVTGGTVVLVESGQARGPIFPVMINRSPVMSYGLSSHHSSQTAGTMLMMEHGFYDHADPYMLNTAPVQAMSW